MGRVIAVGDRNQAIYGFRGAHTGSMDELKERFSMLELPLSISYRCPQAVVVKAQTWVPHIEFHESAGVGFVGEEGTDWKEQANIDAAREAGASEWQALRDFHVGDVILCRLTRPLIVLAFALIRARIPARVLGRDIGQGLTKIIERVCKRAHLAPSADLGAFDDALGGFLGSEREKLLQKGKKAELGRLEDQVATLRVFIDSMEERHGRDPGTSTADNLAGPEIARVADLIGDIERLFTDNGQSGVVLSTVHKAKGLEWDRVFVLDARELMPWKWAGQPWELQQEQNLMYVAATRSKRELRYVTSGELGVEREL